LGFYCLVLVALLFSFAAFLKILSFKEVVGGRFSWLLDIVLSQVWLMIFRKMSYNVK
jgi:hypothetical protein